MESDFYSCFDIRMYIFLHLKFISKHFVVSLCYRYQPSQDRYADNFFSIFPIHFLWNKEIFINSKDLPKLKENEFYWKDLIGKEVKLEDGTLIGVVIEMIETGSDDVLVVQKENQKELIPFNFGKVIKINPILVMKDYMTMITIKDFHTQ